MALTLYAHPFSSYCQKALVALYENATPFRYRSLDNDPAAMAELEKLWPLKKFPVLVDGDKTILETSIIIEHLALYHPGPVQLVPSDRALALEVRLLDRVFDNHVQGPLQAVVGEALRPKEQQDQSRNARPLQQLETIYAWLDRRLANRTWAAGEIFSLADCAAAPALFYADWVQRIAAKYATLAAYRQRLLARPSFARAVEEARPFRGYFPLGAPDRD